MTEREIDYETLAQDAMRSVVRTVLMRVAKSGLPGEHHFYIAFRTDAPGVSLSKRLKAKYPEEMTVVLQHRFWDLIVADDRFEVKLTFDGIAERLGVPYSAIKVFFDPSVPYGLQFEELGGAGAETGLAAPEPAEDAGADHHINGDGPRERSDIKKPRAARRPQGEKAAERTPSAGSDKPSAKLPAPAKSADPGPAANESKVVRLDTFRKK